MNYNDLFLNLGAEFLENSNHTNELKMPNAHEIEPPKYENTLFKEMADDIKSPMEKQICAIESIANSANQQSLSASMQVEVLKSQLELAKKESESAKKDAKFSKFFSLLALAISIVAIIVPLLT